MKLIMLNIILLCHDGKYEFFRKNSDYYFQSRICILTSQKNKNNFYSTEILYFRVNDDSYATFDYL
jgi:hypothetical protein